MTAYAHSGEAELLPLVRIWASSNQPPPGDSRIKEFVALMRQGVSLPPITVKLGADGCFQVCDGLNRVWASKRRGSLTPAVRMLRALGYAIVKGGIALLEEVRIVANQAPRVRVRAEFRDHRLIDDANASIPSLWPERSGRPRRSGCSGTPP